MLISSRGRYALLVMIDLAGHRGGLVPGRQIAERLELSQKYLERILRTLAEAGLIEGSHGKGGGYRLLRSPADYTAGEILRAAEGTLACLGEDVQLTPRRPPPAFPRSTTALTRRSVPPSTPSRSPA